MPVQTESRPMRVDEVVHFASGDHLALHHLDTDAYYLLNEVGTFLWERCDGELTVTELAAELSESFDVDAEVAERDVVSWLDEMVAEDCVSFAASDGL
jgi:hypothetical protein